MQGKQLGMRQFVSPLTASIRNRWFRGFLIALAVYLLVEASTVLGGIREYGISTVKELKVILTTPAFEPLAGTSFRVVLLRKGCVSLAENLTWSSATTEFATLSSMEPVRLPAPTELDGFSLTLSKAIDATYPSLIVLKGSNDDGQTWTTVGSSSFRYVARGVRFLNTEGSLSGQHLSFDFCPSWPLFTGSAVDSILLALCCLGAALCGSFGKQDVGMHIFMWAFALLALNAFTSGVGFLCLSIAKDSVSPFVTGLLYIVLILVLNLAESKFFDVLRLLTVIGIVGQAINDCAIYNDCSHFRESPPVECIALFLLCMLFGAMRASLGIRTVAAVTEDRKAFDRKWAAIVADDGVPSKLEQLETLTNQIIRECEGISCRQYNRRRIRSTLDDAAARLGRLGAQSARQLPVFRLRWQAQDEDFECLNTVAGAADEYSPVFSLDQLYYQAMGVVGTLHALCVTWATASGGTLHCECRGPAEPPPADPGPFSATSLEQAHTRSMIGVVKWWVDRRMMKGSKRSVAKAVDCHLGDASYLLDICRCRIVFDGVGGLLACLEGIRAAPGVRIVRIKNSMTDSHNSWQSAGFRRSLTFTGSGFGTGGQSVLINLCVDTEETRSIGVELHVCEIQLVLKPFVEYKSAEEEAMQHARYINFRVVRKYVGAVRKRLVVFGATVWPLAVPPEPAMPAPHARLTQIEVEHPAPAQPEAFDPDSLLATPCGRGDVGDSSGLKGSEVGEEKRAVRPFAGSDVAYEVYRTYLRSTLSAGAVLHSKAYNAAEAFQLSSAGSVWFTSKPLRAVASKRLFQFSDFLLAAYLIAIGAIWIAASPNSAAFQASVARLNVLELRDGSLPPSSVNISSFGLLKDGCRVDGQSGSLAVVNNSAVVRLGGELVANGYYFVTSAGPASADPVRWSVEVAAAGNGSAWHAVGASAWRTNLGGSVDLFPQVAFPTPAGRGQLVSLDMRWTWPDTLLAIANSFLWALGLLLVIVAALAGVEHLSDRILASFVALQVLAYLTAAVGYHQQGLALAMGQALLYVPSFLVLLVGVFWYEAKIVLVYFLFSEVFAAGGAIGALALYRDGFVGMVRNVAQGPSTTLFGFAVFMVWLRARALHQARQLIVEDRKRYDDIWAAVVQGSEARQGLRELQAEVERLMQGRSPLPPRQLCRRPDTRGLFAEEVGIPGEPDPSRPARLLDQLFVQAACMHPILLGKVKAWAGVSQGLFAVGGTHEYVTLAQSAADPRLKLKFAKIKTVSRAVEKLLRAYGQDVSRLVDLCRQSIVFDKVADLLACLKVVAADEEVVILRIKNRLDPDYDAAASAGYRDVALNLRIVSAESMELGAETHVCELQLLLRPIAELKSDEGHKRYVSFRNLRGE